MPWTQDLTTVSQIKKKTYYGLLYVFCFFFVFVFLKCFFDLFFFVFFCIFLFLVFSSICWAVEVINLDPFR